jgi:lipopolysaccharide export system protein LptA
MALLHVILVSACCILLSSNAGAQEVTKVEIQHASFLKYNKSSGRTLQKLIGDVILRQGSTLFYCDSAMMDNSINSFEAVGNVHISYADSVDLYGYYLNYDGNTRIAELDSNVRMVDKRATLYCDHLWYERNQKMAYYNKGGRIVDKENVLTSKTGRYYNETNEFFFKDSVVLTNPDYIMHADTMKYNTSSEIVYIEGPTTIVGQEDFIFSEKGWYDTRNNVTQLTRNNLVSHNEQLLKADTIFYDREHGFGRALRNISMHDTLQDVILRGDIAEFNRKKGYSYITNNALAILIDKKDSLFMHADSMKMLFDSSQQAQTLFAYHHMKFYREDMQGMCDSLIYRVKDSVISLYKNPVIWSGRSQLTSDSIDIFVSHNHVDSIIFYNTGFIISKDSTTTFNQIKGKQMRGYFRENDLYRIRVLGNAETVYFVREDNGSMIGINKSISSDMVILLKDKKVKDIIYLTQPDATLFPEKELTDEDVVLKGFNWMGEKRPVDKKAIFNW